MEFAGGRKSARRGAEAAGRPASAARAPVHLPPRGLPNTLPLKKNNLERLGSLADRSRPAFEKWAAEHTRRRKDLKINPVTATSTAIWMTDHRIPSCRIMTCPW